jgi:hypothetical protein
LNLPALAVTALAKARPAQADPRRLGATFCECTKEGLVRMLRLVLTALISAGVALSVSCDKTSQSETVFLVLQGDPEATGILERLIKENPTLIHPRSGTQYKIKIVKPDPHVDYKIAKIAPDPKVDYKIFIVDPKSGKEITRISSGIQDAILKQLQQKSEEVKARKPQD